MNLHLGTAHFTSELEKLIPFWKVGLVGRTFVRTSPNSQAFYMTSPSSPHSFPLPFFPYTPTISFRPSQNMALQFEEHP